MEKSTYKDFGVDIEEGNKLVKALTPLVAKTYGPLVVGGLGGFSGRFALPSGYKDPILCAATDGVGSKLKLALQHDRLDHIGQDLVAMCVNDLLCDFATPLFFLDYYATHKLVKEEALRVIGGIAKGCRLAGCALIGGESAELPSLYSPGDFDLAGFALGMAERADLARPSSIEAGDVLLALPSSGLHSNGYSLARGIVETKNLDLEAPIEGGASLLDSLLEPTRIYTEEVLALKEKIKGLAHITGGGLKENLIRILPKQALAVIKKSSLRIHPLFKVFLPYVSEEEAYLVFNMGVGLVIVASRDCVDYIKSHSQAYEIGHIESGDRAVLLD